MSKLVEVKVASVMAVCLILHTLDLSQVEATLRDITGSSDDFFDGDFAVIDIGSAQEASVSWKDVIKLIRRYNLNPVAVRHAPKSMHAAIRKSGLAIDESQSQRDKEPTTEVRAVEVIETKSKSNAPMIVDTPVRAGQRIYAQDRDLIITAVVNNGAEVIADGSIHIYAPLRGRALAGANGDSEARIFAYVMEPELVSIAGVYRTFENGFPPNWARKTAQVRLDGESVLVEPLDAITKS